MLRFLSPILNLNVNVDELYPNWVGIVKSEVKEYNETERLDVCWRYLRDINENIILILIFQIYKII